MSLSDADRLAQEAQRRVSTSKVCKSFHGAMGQEHCQRCGRNEDLHLMRFLLSALQQAQAQKYCIECRATIRDGDYDLCEKCEVASQSEQAQAPKEEMPVLAAALLTKLKEECEAQHARAEAAEAKLAAREQAQARPEIETQLQAGVKQLITEWRRHAIDVQTGAREGLSFAQQWERDREHKRIWQRAEELEAVLRKANGAASSQERGKQAAAPPWQPMRDLIAKWREREMALCRKADAQPSTQYAQRLAAEAEGMAHCADELERALPPGIDPIQWTVRADKP